MARQRKTDLGTDQVFALGHGEGKIDQIKGYYLGSRDVTTSNGESKIHVFQTPKGNTGIWGTKKLNDNLTPSDRGVYQEIFYKGKVKLQGGKTQHTYEFNVDTENTIAVTALPVGVVAADAEETEDTVESEEFTAVDQEALAMEQAARAKRVQDMLNRGKSAKK